MSSRKRSRLQRNARAADQDSKDLQFAAANGDARTVGRLLSKNVEVNAESRGTGNLLRTAVERGHVEVVRVLLNHGANFNEAGGFFNNSTPLHVAAVEGRVEVLSLLLSLGAFVDAKDVYGRTPLHLTAKHNMPGCAKLLLDFRADVNVCDVHNISPLHLAARNGCAEIARMLLIAGADVNAVDKKKHSTPIHGATINGHLEVVKLLLDQNAAIDVEDRCRKTPLHYAIATNRLETAELLLSYQSMDIDGFLFGESETLLHLSARNGYINAIGWLLSKGVDVNKVNLYSETPLHSAVMGEQPLALKVLLSAGASVSAADEYGDTPLHLAVLYGCREVIELLLRAGSSVNAADNLANTPLHLAAWRGNKTVLEFLLSSGADVNAANAYDQTPLHFANHECTDVLHRHVVKMMALNMFVNESNSLTIRSDDEMISFKLDCEEEIELMKGEEIINGVSFIDILTKNPRKLIMYARNMDISKSFESNVYLSKFPIYAGKIKESFAPAIERGLLMESGHRFFDLSRSGLPHLAYVCSEEILLYLSNTDLQVLKDIAESFKSTFP